MAINHRNGFIGNTLYQNIEMRTEDDIHIVRFFLYTRHVEYAEEIQKEKPSLTLGSIGGF